jgi:hypothetical protein
MPFQSHGGWRTFFGYGKEGLLVPVMVSYELVGQPGSYSRSMAIR